MEFHEYRVPGINYGYLCKLVVSVYLVYAQFPCITCAPLAVSLEFREERVPDVKLLRVLVMVNI